MLSITRNPEMAILILLSSVVSRQELELMRWWLEARNHRRRELKCVSSANVELIIYSEKTMA